MGIGPGGTTGSSTSSEDARNPSWFASMWYRPDGSAGNSNFPDSSVQLTQLFFVSVFVSRTIAPGMGLASGFRMMPVTAGPVARCAADCSDCACGGGVDSDCVRVAASWADVTIGIRTSESEMIRARCNRRRRSLPMRWGDINHRPVILLTRFQ